jgi:hypothetical protein
MFSYQHFQLMVSFGGLLKIFQFILLQYFSCQQFQLMVSFGGGQPELLQKLPSHPAIIFQLLAVSANGGLL